jgi:hypothetical protein
VEGLRGKVRGKMMIQEKERQVEKERRITMMIIIKR